MAKGDRLLAAARARVILPAAGAVWAGAEALHAEHAGTLGVAGLAAGLTGVTYGSRRARPLAPFIAPAASWAAAAARYGPLAGPRWYYPVTITWGAGALAALIAAHKHPRVREAREWRDARRALNAEANALGIRGAHLVKHEKTRLGERWVLDITGTGRRASQIVHSGLAERIAMFRDLPKSRVHVTEGRLAKHVVVSIRTKDPWKHPIPHPLFDDDPEITLSVPCTITEPVIVGQDPETGDPLTLTLWDEIGGKVIMVVGKRGAGKDVLLDCIRERVTASYDGDLWEINVSKSVNERAWREACEYAACGPEEAETAVRILLAARRLGDERGAAPRATTTLRPTKRDRLKVIIINETDALFQLPNIDPAVVKRELRYITSKLRSEGFALVFASQRAVYHWIGGTDVKANIDYVCVGKVQNPGEVNHAVGQILGASLPDMSTYGEGQPGVWCVVEDGGAYQAGRTFELPANGDLEVLRELARERSRRVPAMAGTGPLPAGNLLGGNDSPGGDPSGGAPTGNSGQSAPDDALARLDADLERTMDSGTRALLDKIGATQAKTKKILEETPPPHTLSGLDPDKEARSVDERWRQVAEQAIIPSAQRAQLLDLLGGDGTTISAAAKTLGQSVWITRTWLERLRRENLAAIRGKGRGARWVRPETTGGDDG